MFFLTEFVNKHHIIMVALSPACLKLGGFLKLVLTLTTTAALYLQPVVLLGAGAMCYSFLLLLNVKQTYEGQTTQRARGRQIQPRANFSLGKVQSLDRPLSVGFCENIQSSNRYNKPNLLYLGTHPKYEMTYI